MDKLIVRDSLWDDSYRFIKPIDDLYKKLGKFNYSKKKRIAYIKKAFAISLRGI